MPTVQTVVFENVEVDVSNNKQLFIHPIHRIVATEFPIKLGFAVLSCCYDLRPGNYNCRHSLLSGDKKQKIIDFSHEAIKLDTDGGGMGFRTSFENVEIKAPGKYWIRTEVTHGVRAEDILLRIEEQKKGGSRLNVKA